HRAPLIFCVTFGWPMGQRPSANWGSRRATPRERRLSPLRKGKERTRWKLQHERARTQYYPATRALGSRRGNPFGRTLRSARGEISAGLIGYGNGSGRGTRTTAQRNSRSGAFL